MAGPDAQPSAWENWAGNQRATSVAVRTPADVDDLLSDIRSCVDAGQRIKPIGNGHSFTDIARAHVIRLDMSGLADVVRVDRAAKLVTVQAGMPLRVLNEVLAAHGLALPNLGDIDAQTISGAISTGTHGTGAAFGCLSSFVSGLTLATASGDVIRCSATENPDVFAAARVGLGALGVITEVTLRCVDGFTLRAREGAAPVAALLSDLPELLAANDHVELYWFPYTDSAQFKLNNRVPADSQPLPAWRAWLDDEFMSNTVFSALCRIGRAVPTTMPAINSFAVWTLSLGRTFTGRSDRVFCRPRRVRFVEMEYALPREALSEVFAELRRIVDRLPFKVLFPVELRFTAGDDAWLSHGYGRESAYVAIHQYVGAPYEPYFRAFEQVCTRVGGRPHWGKLHYRDAGSLRPAYPRFDDFRAVRDRLDPDRIFANAYTDRVLGP